MGLLFSFLCVLMGSPLLFPPQGTLSGNDSPEVMVYSLLEKNQSVEVTDGFEVVNTQEVKVTILRPEGLMHAQIAIPYDNLTSIENFRGTVRNPTSGKILQKLKIKDLKDRSIISDFSVFEDNRLKHLAIHSPSFPIEVSFTVITKTKGNFYIPSWHPAPHSHQKIVSSDLHLQYPKSKGIRYLPAHIDADPLVCDSLGKVSLYWTLTDLPAYSADTPSEDQPELRIAPRQFSMEGYSSTMEDWEGLGKWINLLNKDNEALPDEARQLVARLTQGLETNQEKIAVLYQYLQDNYRYVSIQLGIGGWRPMPAREAFKLKYGDCKALTVLMMALLKEAGIDSYYSLIKAGASEKDLLVNFPSNQFNHVILQVPGADTLWLECTSRVLPAGFLGEFTMNRTALVINEEGGYLHRTPDYKPLKFNQHKSKSEIKLLDKGEAELFQTIEFDGFGALPFLVMDKQNDRKEIQRQLYNQLSIAGGLYMEDYELSVSNENSIPRARLAHHSFLEKFYQSTAKRVTITPNFKWVTPDDLPNKNMMLEETIVIFMPTELEGENLLPIRLDAPHFVYERQVDVQDNQLILTRTLKLHFPENTSKEVIVQNLDQIRKLDLQPLFFKKP